MNLSLRLKSLALTAATIGVLGGVGQALARTTEVAPTRQSGTQLAQTFGNTPVNSSNFLVVSVPGSTSQPHRLFVVEQIQPSPACWSIVDPNAEPTAVNDLWNNFDYSGICRLQRDSNGYAVWAGGDIGAGGIFELNERNGNILLQYRTSLTSRQRFTIGQTNGISPTGFTQVDLNPGWSLTKRTYQGQIVGSNLVYFTNDMTVAQLLEAEGSVATGPSDPSRPPGPTTPPSVPFNDISGNLYASQIARAASLGLISGYAEDGTFRPKNPLTREQGVSMVMEAAKQVLPTSLLAQVPQSVFSDPFPDVAANRWSALKIQQAKDLELVTGDFGTGNFRPADPLSRAELIAMMNKLARLRTSADAADDTGTPVPDAVPTTDALAQNIPNPPTFTDISGHWGETVIREMAGYCGVATPLNESGTNFAPEMDALRDYAAAATVRLVDCPAARTGGGV